MLRKFLLGGWYLIVSVLLLLALVISIARGYPEIYQKYLPAIQDNISSLLGRPVHADSIRIDWHGITPIITTRNFSMFEDESEYDQLLNVDKATISLDLYKSLLHRELTFKELTFIGAHIDVARTADDRVVLNGIDISERLALRKKLNQKNKLIVNLLDSSISIEDEVKNLNYFFDRVDVGLGFSGEHLKVSSKFILPETLGESLVIIADIRDLDKGLKNIKGDLYSKGKNINLELLNDFFPKLQVGVSKGISDFQIWGDFNSLEQRSLVGSFGVTDLIYRDVAVPIIGSTEDEEITAINANFRFNGDTNNWQLALNEVNIQTPSQKWPAMQYELSCQKCEEQAFILAAALDYIHVDQLLSTLQHFPFIAKRLNEVLDKVELHGEFQDTKLLAEFKEQTINKYSYQSSLQDASVFIPKYEFSVSPITGRVSGDHKKGSISLATQSTTVILNKILNQQLDNQNITGVIEWQFRKDHQLFKLQKILVESNEMTANVQGVAQIVNSKPYIDIQIAIPEVQAATIKQYLPYKRMKPKLSKWLDESIAAGTLKNGKLLIHGNPKNFPFKDKPGRFQIIADVEEGVLDYRKNWPIASNIAANFEINNNYLVLNASQGSILDSSLQAVRAEIKDLKLPKLEINGNAVGPAKNILEYLQQSSLLPENSQIVKQITAGGNSKLDLNIVLTLTKKLEKQRLVSGVIEFHNANLNVNALSLPFTNLNGKLKFDQSGAEGIGLTAKLYGAPITASAEKFHAGRTKLFITGDFHLDTYFANNYTKLNKYIKGTAPISAEVNLPSFNKNSTDKSLLVDVTSDLYGTVSLLPEPLFNKLFDEKRQLSIHTKHQKDSDSKIYASLDNEIFMQAEIGRETGKMTRMEVRMGNEQFILPESGVKISGRLKQLNLGQWRDLINSEQENKISVNEIDLYVNQVTLGNLKLNNVDFRAQKNTQFWSGNINSSVAKGRFEYPVDTDSGSVATAEFDYIRFNSPSSSSKNKPTKFDPRSLPALVVNANQFEFKDAKFTDVSLKTKPSESGLTIDSLQGYGSDLHVTANGTWDVSADNTHTTKLTITLLTENMHNSLTGLGFDSAITDGEGRVTANFSWPKAPYQFSLASVTGNANLRFKEGAISSVEPGGAGRLIGLVNLSEITRRLSLDFTDFFSKGYTFEKIRGDLVFKDANLTTENLRVKGPSADILIQGRTGISTKDYDQVVTVTPHVSGGLPWIGLAVGGPLGAVGVMVGEKIAKTIGVDVDKVTQVKYSMTGSWDDPKIEPIAQKIAEKNPTNQGQPSPNSPPQSSPQVSSPQVSPPTPKQPEASTNRVTP